jgi:hypothetical protein
VDLIESEFLEESSDLLFLAGGCFEFLMQGLKVKVNFTLEQATKARRGRRGIALLFL